MSLKSQQEHDKIAQLLKNYFGITLETREVSFKGWNWGVADFQGAWSYEALGSATEEFKQVKTLRSLCRTRLLSSFRLTKWPTLTLLDAQKFL
jgi:hypothetical protein